MKSKFNILYEQIMNSEKIQNKILVIIPGSFKPPHKGHMEMIQKYYNMQDIDEIHVFISNISKEINSNKNLSISQLNPLFKLISKFESNKAKYQNQLLVSKIESAFNNLKNNVENLTFNVIKKQINQIINIFNEVKTSEFDKIIDKLYNYLNNLEKAMFKTIRLDANNKEITAQQSKEIFELFLKDCNLNTNKVYIHISSDPSPIKDAYRWINNNCNNCTIILGVSKKDNDDLRFNGVQKYENNTIITRPVDVETLISASDIRKNINNLQKDWFPDKLTDQSFEKIKQILM